MRFRAPSCASKGNPGRFRPSVVSNLWFVGNLFVEGLGFGRQDSRMTCCSTYPTAPALTSKGDLDNPSI